MKRNRLTFLLATLFFAIDSHADEELTSQIKIEVEIDRGEDIGQCFGSIFEATSADGAFVIGAGFQNAYNTRYRADRHAVQFYLRPTDGNRTITVQELPRPSENLTGAYLFDRDGKVYSTYGGLKTWDAKSGNWTPADEAGGTNESMRVGNGLLVFGDSQVSWNGQTILPRPTEGSYQLFFYANGYLCFYHVNRRDQPYHRYENDEDGFSRLYACPWKPGQDQVDLSQATILNLPIVGETTFAWGVFGQQIVTGSNIGGFYVFENNSWKMLLEPQLGVSYQLYSTLAFHDRILMGQYPTGRLFAYDGKTISDQPGWPPVMEGVAGHAREAQTATTYGGDLIVGVWPWGEVWRHNPDSKRWVFTQRMFSHPPVSDEITHPYDVENQENSPGNLWGQRITSLVTNGPDLFVSTSAKAPYEWQPERYPFLRPDKWKSYGKVYRVTIPGHLSASLKWTEETTKLQFLIDSQQMLIQQDNKLLATSPLPQDVTRQVGKLQKIEWGKGIYGPSRFRKLDGHRVSVSVRH